MAAHSQELDEAESIFSDIFNFFFSPNSDQNAQDSTNFNNNNSTGVMDPSDHIASCSNSENSVIASSTSNLENSGIVVPSQTDGIVSRENQQLSAHFQPNLDDDGLEVIEVIRSSPLRNSLATGNRHPDYVGSPLNRTLEASENVYTGDNSNSASINNIGVTNCATLSGNRDDDNSKINSYYDNNNTDTNRHVERREDCNNGSEQANESFNVEKSLTEQKENKGDDGGDGDDDDVVEVLGSSEIESLPHLRQDCMQYSFSDDQHEKFCPKCYCFICDAPVPSCNFWKSHCHANTNDKNQKSFWKEEKRRYQSFLPGSDEKNALKRAKIDNYFPPQRPSVIPSIDSTNSSPAMYLGANMNGNYASNTPLGSLGSLSSTPGSATIVRPPGIHLSPTYLPQQLHIGSSMGTATSGTNVFTMSPLMNSCTIATPMIGSMSPAATSSTPAKSGSGSAAVDQILPHCLNPSTSAVIIAEQNERSRLAGDLVPDHVFFELLKDRAIFDQQRWYCPCGKVWDPSLSINAHHIISHYGSKVHQSGIAKKTRQFQRQGYYFG